MNHLTFNYELLIKKVKSLNPKNDTELYINVFKILGQTGKYDHDKLEVVVKMICELDQDLKDISKNYEKIYDVDFGD